MTLLKTKKRSEVSKIKVCLRIFCRIFHVFEKKSRSKTMFIKHAKANFQESGKIVKLDMIGLTRTNLIMHGRSI